MKRLGLVAAAAGICLLVAGTTRAQTPFGGDDTGCLPDTKDHAKCSAAVLKGFGKLVGAVVKCHNKQATAAFKMAPPKVAEEDCENAAKAKFDAVVTKVTPICSGAVLAGTAAFESVLLGSKSNPQSLDGQNGNVYCEGTADIDPSGDDAGKIPSTADILKCENTVGKNLGKLTAGVLKCHAGMAKSGLKGGSTDDETCENAAVAKFDAGTAKLTTCPSCLNAATQHALADSPTIGVTAQADGSNFIVYPCPATTTTTGAGTTTTGGATTTTSGATTTTTIAGACCGFTPKPGRLTFTTGIGTGNSGTTQFSNGATLINLARSGLYTGGGSNAVPLPYTVPDLGNSLTSVTACSGTALTLGNVLSSDPGATNRNCTSIGCRFGPPLPIPNPVTPAISVCVLNTVTANATGTADCSTGASAVSLPLSSALYLDGDLFPQVGGADHCVGGTAAGTVCTMNPDPICTGGGFCSFGIQACPICPGDLKCHGGDNDGATCAPEDSAQNSNFPTSQDCHPPTSQSIGSLPIGFGLSTGTMTATAVDLPSQNRVFCGFCRDINALGSGCFAGDPNTACPASSGRIPCTSNTDCPAAFPDCQQRNPGAFGPAGGSARTITETGSPAAGDLTDGLGHTSTLVSIFCVPPTFTGAVDTAGDLPGPGAVALFGTAQLLP